MEAKSKIEVIQISHEARNLKAAGKTLSREEVVAWLKDQTTDGSIAVVRLSGLSGAQAFLSVLMNGDQGIFSLKGQSARASASPFQLLGLNLSFGQANSSQREVETQGNSAGPANGNRAVTEKQSISGARSNGECMTEAQRRFLFRLLAEKRNLKGKAAEGFLKEHFGVASLHEIEKFVASKFIDRLVNE